MGASKERRGHQALHDPEVTCDGCFTWLEVDADQVALLRQVALGASYQIIAFFGNVLHKAMTPLSTAKITFLSLA